MRGQTLGGKIMTGIWNFYRKPVEERKQLVAVARNKLFKQHCENVKDEATAKELERLERLIRGEPVAWEEYDDK